MDKYTKKLVMEVIGLGARRIRIYWSAEFGGYVFGRGTIQRGSLAGKDGWVWIAFDKTGWRTYPQMLWIDSPDPTYGCESQRFIEQMIRERYECIEHFDARPIEGKGFVKVKTVA